MKGYVRLKEPDEEVFLAEGAGCVSQTDTGTFRVWDNTGLTIHIPADRVVTIRLGTGRRPDGYEPLPQSIDAAL